MAKIVKPVAFNDKDTYHKRLLEHAGQYPNFSEYVRRLIQRDMEGLTVDRGNVNIPAETDEDNVTSDIDVESLI